MNRHILDNLFHAGGSRFLRDDRRYSQFVIGEYTYGKPEVHSWNEGTTLRIGRFCSIAPGVKILLGGEHRSDWVSTYPYKLISQKARTMAGHPRSKGDVFIGNDVWIGMDALILSGVVIGDGAVIAAKSVCAKDVPPYAIFAGNPARLIRYRFDEVIVEALMKIRWWDWPIEDIQKAIPLLMQPDIDKFIEHCKQNGRFE